MIYNDCRDCNFYKGNCGHHFVDGDDHICYKIPKESYMDGSFGPYGCCFEPSDRYKEEKKKELVANLVNDYPIEYLEEAINMKRAKEEKE